MDIAKELKGDVFLIANAIRKIQVRYVTFTKTTNNIYLITSSALLGRHLGLSKHHRAKNVAKYENTLTNYHFRL